LHYRQIEKIACTSLLRNNNAFAEGKPLNELLAKLVLQKIANQKMSPPQRQRTKAIMLKSMV